MAQHDAVSNLITAPEALDAPLADVLSISTDLLAQSQVLVEMLFRTWNLYQIMIAVGVFVVAHLLRAILGPRVRAWMAARESWPKWRMRILVVVHQRLRAIFFVALIWVVIFTMREMTWPSRSYLLGVVGTLAFAWLAITFATRLIKSPTLRKIVRYGAWTWATLQILGLLEPAEQLLDSIGFSMGDIRFSMLLLIQGLVILGVLISLARFFTTTTTNRIKANEDISPSMQVLIVKGAQIAFYGAAFFLGVRALGIDLTGLASAALLACAPRSAAYGYHACLRLCATLVLHVL